MSIRLIVAAVLLTAGAAGAQTPTSAPAPAPTSAAAPKPAYAIQTVPEGKTAFDQVTAAAKAVKTANGAGKENLYVATVLLHASDKARASKDTATLKALGAEIALAAAAAQKPGAAALKLSDIKAKSLKFAQFVQQVEKAVLQPAQLGSNPEGFPQGLAPANID